MGAAVTIAVVASGPSLTPEAVAYLRDRVRVLGVSDAYRLAPWADWIYSSDYLWWQEHNTRLLASGCTAERWTRDALAAEEFSLRHVTHAQDYGQDAEISGSSSGEHAIRLARKFGATRIILLGFDMGATGQGHWFGAHPRTLVNGSDFGAMLKPFPKLAIDLDRDGIEVVNCTPVSALTCFRTAALERTC